MSGRERLGSGLEQVVFLKHSEQVRLDANRLEDLYRQLGEPAAEEVICRALEEIAARLSHTDRCYRAQEFEAMRKSARSIIAIAEQIGMQLLADVARDVTRCIDMNDGIALAATLARFLRTGEGSLSEIWDLQDLSI